MAKFDLSQIPAVERRKLGKTFLEAVERFYSDPENVRKFEEWQRGRDATRAVETQNQSDKQNNRR